MMEVCEKLGKEITVDLTIQYIQHERIAREFADYYELYRKYSQDYHIAEILEGRSTEAMVKKVSHAPFDQDYHIAEILEGRSTEAMVKKVSHAPFDEKISVVNLIFSGMCQKVREAVTEEAVLEKVFAVLQKLKEDSSEETLLLRLGDYADQMKASAEKKKEQGLLERKEEISDLFRYVSESPGSSYGRSSSGKSVCGSSEIEGRFVRGESVASSG